MKKTVLLVGSSRGIGAELVAYLNGCGHSVIGVSRSKSVNCEWIKGDISTQEGIEDICNKISGRAIDTLIFSAGVWEDKGFMPDFSFLETTDQETRRIMSINVVAPIEITKRLVNSFAKSNNPRAVYIGAMSGVENLVSDQVAYCSSKFALRGAIQGLHKALRSRGIGFTAINPGNVATEEVLLDMKKGVIENQNLIPVVDIAHTVEWLMSLSSNVDIGDINMRQKC